MKKSKYLASIFALFFIISITTYGQDDFGEYTTENVKIPAAGNGSTYKVKDKGDFIKVKCKGNGTICERGKKIIVKE